MTRSRPPASIGRLLVVGGRQWRKRIDQALQAQGLSQATAWPLLVLRTHGEPLRQGVLAEEIGIEGASLVRVIDALEAAGLIERLPDPHDRRARCVGLSAAGAGKAEEIAQIVDRVREEVVAGLPEADLAVAERVLRALHERLDQLNQPTPAPSPEPRS